VTKRQIEDLPLKEAVQAFERQYISEVLEVVDGNRKKAAETLGIHRNTLLAKINELGLKTQS
jgi:DNA-binding NtrC family response regulator